MEPGGEPRAMGEKPLSGRVALVTGGSRGIGRATAMALAEAGAAVAVVDLLEDEVRATAEAVVAAHGVAARGVGVDVTDLARCSDVCVEIAEALGPVTVLVNNAGIMPQEVRPLHAQPIGNFNRMMAVHLGGTAHWSSLAVPAMREAGFGRIVNLSSVMGLVGTAKRVGYTSAKTAITGFTRALAMENARYGITVNAVAPGYILTDVLKERSRQGLLDHDLYAERTPVGRWGRPEEVARVIAFLCHPDSGFINGAVWPVDGGYTVRGDPGEDIGPRPNEGDRDA